jgi:23S rRNA (adenine2030-N6)-methyltransferase
VNYRHAFHAGNFADVFKHSILALLLEKLKQKETAFRVIDTHAGVGLYDLTSSESSRTGEWHDGIGRVWGKPRSATLETLLTPYLSAVAAANENPEPAPLTRYPGSPWIARHLFRRKDRLTAVELHPQDANGLEKLFANDIQVRTIALDGWLALGAFVPPKERRGIVLVDPPFEERDEFQTMLTAFAEAHRKWPTGIYALWYPVKDLAAIDRLRLGLVKSGIRRLLRAELSIRDRDTPELFNGAGLVICNPPWQFEETLEALLGGLVPLLARDPGASHFIDRIAGE